MGQYKTPGVYIVEKSAFPNSVVEVATAVPAFIGYTEKANNKGKTLLNKAWRISSMSEFISFFGGPPKTKYQISEAAAAATTTKKGKDGADTAPAAAAVESDFASGSKEYILELQGARYFLYHSMMLFFQNGGGACYVISVGSYADGGIDKPKLSAGIDILLKEQEPTMVVIPDAMSLAEPDCIALQQAALSHCGQVMKNRFAILDVFDGYKEAQDSGCIEKFRNDLGTNSLDFAAAYYPWLNTSIVQTGDLSFANIANADKLQELLKAEVDGSELEDKKKTEINGKVAEIGVTPKTATMSTDEDLHKILTAVCPLYKSIIESIKLKLNLLPPSAGMAGVYTMVDNSRGVWKAPANVSLNAVVSPAVEITNAQQEDLNVTTAGKSINAIRTFIGEGTLVWGARTLDGNSLDWRYINVRRTMIMLEESIKLATKAYVFEPNVSSTWVTIKSMISNFLTSIWKRGGLAGATPEDAFGVFVGLGETMTPQDILDGMLKVTVLVALSRPAEFIEITFQQQMQKS
ncbi:phage tail sheath family protein [Nitrosomonas oligotropha]|uniref:phage tail sheath family protein n=1 Tax=Nitrosomonas oligotropha TaxID=42354 RepID=UPI000D4EF777|nr:phage tail sheath C-terminal domain-containing protein [Nitrosomonas oligotropha]MXS82901.1 phage tail sheath family protein [Nitrosomonas oligotropha]